MSSNKVKKTKSTFKGRLLFSVTNDLLYDQRMIRICTALATAGYEVLLIGRLKKNSLPIPTFAFSTKRLTCYFEKGKFFYLEYNIRLFFFLFSQRADALCAIDLDTVMPNYLVSRIKRVSCVYDAHEFFTETPEVVRRPGIQKIWSFIARLTIPKVDAAYTVGAALAHVFEQTYNKRFAVIRNVPEPSEDLPIKTLEAQTAFWQQLTTLQELDFQTSFSRSIVLYQGALNEGRGLEAMIGAMHELEDLQLWIVGEGDLSMTLREMVREQALDDRIYFLGFLQPDVLKSVTRLATLGINLLENRGLSYYYSLANKAFDFIQAGIPSINMDFPEYRSLNESYGVFHLVDDLKTESLVRAIRKLIVEKAYYDQVQKNCLAARQTLHWGHESGLLLEFWEKVMRKEGVF